MSSITHLWIHSFYMENLRHIPERIIVRTGLEDGTHVPKRIILGSKLYLLEKLFC
jgi:hypothetical protein